MDIAGGREVDVQRNGVGEGSVDERGEGAEVRVVVAEKEGEQGPQASTVKPVGKHHVVG